jgi:tRNA-dihydrouridine synthase
MWTEFVSCEAMTYDAASRQRMMTTLMYAEQERPIVAQLFGSKPEQFYEVGTALKCHLHANSIELTIAVFGWNSLQ